MGRAPTSERQIRELCYSVSPEAESAIGQNGSGLSAKEAGSDVGADAGPFSHSLPGLMNGPLRRKLKGVNWMPEATLGGRMTGREAGDPGIDIFPNPGIATPSRPELMSSAAGMLAKYYSGLLNSLLITKFVLSSANVAIPDCLRNSPPGEQWPTYGAPIGGSRVRNTCFLQFAYLQGHATTRITTSSRCKRSVLAVVKN